MHRIWDSFCTKKFLSVFAGPLFFLCQILITCLVPGLLFGQSGSQSYLSANKPPPYELGAPHIHNYSPKEYNKHAQNWWATQDERGVMYFANGDGILEYDGVSWRLIQNSKHARGRSLDIAADGTIYAGLSGDLGFLSTDSTGSTVFVSLLEKLNEEDRNFTEVWKTFATKDGVFFQTATHLFRWFDGKMHVWPCGERNFFLAYKNRETLFVVLKGRGLLKVSGDSLVQVIDNETYPLGIRAVLSLRDDRMLICSREGLFFLKENGLERFSTEADSFIAKNNLSAVAMLADGTIALSTYRGGIAIIDTTGMLLQIIDESSGLQTSDVKNLFVDRENNLWAPLKFGIAKISWPSPFTYFGKKQGVKGLITAITRYRGEIVAGGSQGLHKLTTTGRIPEDAVKPKFTREKNIAFEVNALYEIDGHLVIATSGRPFELHDDKIKDIPGPPIGSYVLHQSQQDSNVIFLGLDGGVGVIRLQNDKWVSLGELPGITADVESMAEPTPGTLWIGTSLQGVVKATIDFEKNISVKAELFAEEQILPNGQVFVFEGRPFFSTSKGLKRFDEPTQTMQPDSTFGAAVADTTIRVSAIYKMAEGRFLISIQKGDIGYYWLAIPRENGGFELDKNIFTPLAEYGTIYSSFPDKNGITWFGCNTGVIRYDPSETTILPASSPLIRQLSIIPGDSLLFGGNGHPTALTLPYESNSFHIDYSLPSYIESSKSEYKYFLEGFDRKWSDWSKVTKKEYTGLFEGDYVFAVQARNIYGHVSQVPGVEITVLPPWYRSWWAYFLYVLFTVSAVFAIVKARVSHLEKKTHELEAIVADRTAIIREQTEKLKELDVAKSRFFANISHDFRTPLTLILGPVEDLIAKVKGKSSQNELSLIRRNANFLLRLINQLLDLSRLESGKLNLEAIRGDLVKFLKGIVMSFASLAEQKKITLRFEVVADASIPSQAFFDHDKIEQIFYNLLSNAFKFSTEGGTVSCFVGHSSMEGSDFIEITIRDTGIGIPKDRLDYVFDRFYQVDSATTRTHEGTGIGLALTKELVKLHKGEITVESEEGKGTAFLVRLPVGKDHLQESKPDETTSYEPPRLDTPVSADSAVTKEAGLQPPKGLDNAKIILIVDDHPDVRKYIRKHLDTDFQIFEARDGEEGVEIATEVIPDLVISDVMMPKLDGYQLCEALKTNEKTSHIPVILLTAKAGEEDKLAGLEIGADDYLSKPFNSKELHVRVRNLIELRRKLQKRFQKEGLLKPREVSATSVEEAFLTRMMNVLEENLGDEDFGVESLSSALNTGRRQLHRKIKALTGETPSDFIRSVRLQRAKQLLEQKAGNVSEIAFQTGFSSLPYFSTAFKEQFGKLPSEV